jgi:hypothetical protein
VTASTQKSAPRMAAIRLRRQQEGLYETTVFVHLRVRDAIDEAIAAGRFKSRREAMEHAISSMFRVKEGATKPR